MSRLAPTVKRAVMVLPSRLDDPVSVG